MGRMYMFFVSKKDTLYFIIMWGTFVFLFIITIQSLILDGIHIIRDVLMISIMVFILFGWFRTGYQIENETIKIKSGLFHTKVNIRDIRKITKEKSVLAGASLAIDRLVLHFDNYKQLQISPKKEAEFIELLQSKNPNIELDEKRSDI